MARTHVDIDDEACAAVIRRYGLATKREAVNRALRSLASEPFRLKEARRMRGSGWDGNLDEMRGTLEEETPRRMRDVGKAAVAGVKDRTIR